MNRSRVPLASLGFVLVLAWGTPAASRADPTAGYARITAHRISIRLEPATHAFVAKDTVTLVGRGPLMFFSPPSVAVSRVLVSGESVPVDLTNAGDPRLNMYGVPLPAGTTEAEIWYAGHVFDEVTRRDDLSWVVGDSTRGIVSEKGIFLSEESNWYPYTGADGLARFDVTSYVPEPFLVVTQGDVPERSSVAFPKGWASETEVAPPEGAPGEKGAVYARAVARARLPTEGCSLSAGPYRVSTKTTEGIVVSTYFLEGEAADAPLWLDEAARIVERYEAILGTYPHPKFDVVENFFATGYGLPSYTLLGDEVIRYVTAGAKGSGGKIPPGYLDHEYVHGWFGNGLFVDPADGNWCEALTTYFSNYYAKELESQDAAREHRRGVLEHYAIRMGSGRDYPVRAFKTKREDKDNDVGYGKGSLVFHALRRRLGDERFFAAVKAMATSRVGTYVSWKDWLAALDGEWARPFLERKGLPAIRLASASWWPAPGAGGSGIVRAEAVIDQPRGEAPWPAVDLPVALDGKPAGLLHLEGKSGVWTREVGGESPPGVVEIDPGYDALRRIADGDLPACLNRTLETRGAVVERVGAEATFGPLAERLAKEKGLVALPPGQPEDGTHSAVRLLVKRPGEALTTTATGERRLSVPGGGTKVEVDGKSWSGDDISFLVSQVRDGRPETWFVAMSDDAASRAKYMTYYGWDQYVVWKAGQRTPLTRGFLDREPKATRRVPTTDDGASRVRDDLARLASDFGGRGPGTPGHEAAVAFLLDRLKAAVPERKGWHGDYRENTSEFGLGVADLVSPRDLVLTTEKGTEVLHDAFRPLWNSAEREAGKPLPFAEGAGAVPLPGKIADTSPEGLALFGQQVAAGTAPAILIAPTVEARKALAPLLDAPNAITPESSADLARPGRDGKPRGATQVAPAIAARRTRAWPTAAPLRVPILVLEESAVERLDREPRITAIDFAVKFGPERDAWERGAGGKNVTAALLPPGSPERPPAVLVSAHYDSWGEGYAGADDNGSGVACVLEAARLVAGGMAEGTPRRAVIVALFDGEEWGLQGSRALVGTITKAFDVQAVVNVDAVGRVRDDSVYVVGLSTVPDLGGKAKAALERNGLRAGADIDAFAYREGSDHWPFHEAGIPAIDFYASDYATMDTPADTLDKVDPVGVARLARAVSDLVLRLAAE